MEISNSISKVPKSYFLFAFTLLLIFLSRPLWVDVTVPILPIVAIFFAGFYVASIYGVLYMRAKSTPVLVDSGVRESASLLKPLIASTSVGGDFPPMVTLNVGGAAALQAAYPNKNIVHVPKDSVEFLGPPGKAKAALIYSPAQPIDGKLLQGISGSDYDIALKSAHSGFLPKTAFVYFSFLNSLRGEDTEEMKRAVDNAITKYARSSQEDREHARLRSEALIKDFKAIAGLASKKSAKGKLMDFFLPQQANDLREQQETLKQRAQ